MKKILFLIATIAFSCCNSQTSLNEEEKNQTPTSKNSDFNVIREERARVSTSYVNALYKLSHVANDPYLNKVIKCFEKTYVTYYIDEEHCDPVFTFIKDPLSIVALLDSTKEHCEGLKLENNKEFHASYLPDLHTIFVKDYDSHDTLIFGLFFAHELFHWYDDIYNNIDMGPENEVDVWEKTFTLLDEITDGKWDYCVKEATISGDTLKCIHSIFEKLGVKNEEKGYKIFRSAFSIKSFFVFVEKHFEPIYWHREKIEAYKEAVYLK